MNTMLVFMLVCLILGLWVKPRYRYGLAIMLILAFALVMYFWLRPYQM